MTLQGQPALPNPHQTVRERIEYMAHRIKAKESLPPGAEVSMADMAEVVLRMIGEYARRMRDALNLYKPLPGECTLFHASMAQTRLIYGSNQSSKTVTASAEIARIARGMDPYNKRDKKDLVILAVGKDGDHIGDTMWEKLWMPGLFEIVPDEVTGAWRAVRPDPNNLQEIDPIDLDRKDLWMPSPPLIPPSALRGGAKGIAWDKKNANIPRKVYFANGTKIYFHSSNGSPRQGYEVDVGWFDEEIENERWYGETQARLLKRNGIFIWSATPQASTAQLLELHDRCVCGEENIAEFKVLLEDNPYVPKQAKINLYNSLKHDPDNLAVRYYGEWAILGRKVYQMYDLEKQGVDPFTPPDDWMRVLAIDPGTSACAAVALAVKPPKKEEDEDDYEPEHGQENINARKKTIGHPEEVHCYKEIFLKNATAKQLAEAVKEITHGHKWEVFIIDHNGGRQRPMGHSYTVAEHYYAEFTRLGIQSRLSEHGFEWGSNEVSGRELSLKRWLTPDADGKTILKIHRGLDFLDKQFKDRYYKKTDPTKREERTQHDVLDALEYACAYFDAWRPVCFSGLYYHKPVKSEGGPMTPYDHFLKFKKDEQRKNRLSLGRGLSLGSLGGD